MTIDEAITEIGNSVYDATSLFEKLENTSHVVGNGHHMSQYAAKEAMRILYEHWKNKEEKEKWLKEHRNAIY